MNTRNTLYSLIISVLCSIPAYSYAALPMGPICTMEYAPVCGQTYENGYPVQRTYSNTCMLDNSRASFLYHGQCNIHTPHYPQYQQLNIQSVSGPTQLKVNQSGTWAISVIGAQGQLSYHVTWGDEVTPMYAYAAREMIAPVSNTGTFTHTYNRAGTYTVTMYVYDSTGRSAQGTITVVVRGNTSVQYPHYPVYYDDYPDYSDEDYWDYLWYQNSTKKKPYYDWDYGQYYGTGFHPTSSYVYNYPYYSDDYSYTNQYHNYSWDSWSHYSDVY